MRIRSLHVDGFGKFTGFDCGPLEEPVTVFLGANEAGKSTLLAFIRRVLFGFPDGRSRRNPYPPLSGGRHGGSVTAVTDAGEVVTLSRFSGAGGGTATLTSAAGEPIASTELQKLLGNHSRSVFENVFAFTLDELQDDALLRDESINSQIYSAGMGATKLPGALKVLGQDKSRIFLKGGRKHAIHEAAGALEKVDSGLRDVQGNAERYGWLSSRLAQIEHELKRLSERRLRGESELEGYRDLQRARDDWHDLLNAELQLQQIPEIAEFPENGVGRLETLDQRAAAAREEREKVSRLVQSARGRAALPIKHESILQESAVVRRLERARSAFDQSVRDLPKREAELTANRSRLEQTLADLGPDWNADRLSRFDLSIVVREEVSAHADRLHGELAKLNHLQSALLQDEKAVEEASQAVEQAREELNGQPPPVLDADGIRERRNRIREARNTLDEFNRLADRAEDLRSQLDDHTEGASPARPVGSDKVLATILAAAGLTGLLFSGAFMGNWMPLVGSATAALLILAAAAYLFLRTGPLARPAAGDSIGVRIRRQADDAEQRLEALRGRRAAQARELGIESPDVDTLDAQAGVLDREEARLAEWHRLKKALAQAETLLERRQVACADSAKAVKDAETALESAKVKWRQWLVARKLQQTFSPQNIEVLERLVDLGRTHHAEVVAMEGRISAIQEDIDRFIADVVPIATTLCIELDASDHLKVARIADELIELHIEVTKQARAREEAQAELWSAEEELTNRVKRLREVEDETAALLNSAGAENAEEFRQRAASFAERENLQAQLDSAADKLRRISGPGPELAAFKERLAASKPQVINEEIRRCEMDLENIASTRSELDTERGSVTKEREQLLGEDESSKLRAERNRLLEEMDGHAREWVVRTIAENLLKKARGKFERERQPDVLRHSEKFYSGMTGGRYRTVFSPLGSSEIRVTDDDGSSKQPAQLSRGAREQLFLSLRFGLIRELGQRSERLPVIVDEALVNFDWVRGPSAAHAFVELAEQNQVLVFTCHPQIVDWFANAAVERGVPPPQTITLD